MTRKILIASVFLTLILIIGGATGVFAATYGDFTYMVSNGEVTITDCKETASGEITIPDTLDGYPVTAIGADAFNGCAKLTGISIPASITYIDDAFYNCNKLENVYISDLAAWCGIEYTSFKPYGGPMIYADNLYLNGSLITELVIPDGVTAIGRYAFYDCNSLISVTIPDSVKSIGHSAFGYCKSLTKVIIPDSVTEIGSLAFGYCTGLTDVIIGDGVTTIDNSTFYLCNQLKNLTLGNSVTSIGENAFFYCSKLTSIVFPASVTAIGSDAFYHVYFKTVYMHYSSALNYDFGNAEIITYSSDYAITYILNGTMIARERLLDEDTPKLLTPPYGYTYKYYINNTEWDGIVTGNLTVTVIKTPIIYTITYTGECNYKKRAEYLTKVNLPTPPYGYTYSFTVNGREWGGTVTGELTVKVTKIPITYTITYDGDYEDETYADYNTNVTFPTPPYGYTYSFTANGEEWDGTVTGDLTVTVTKTPVTYTITYAGDYVGETRADYNTNVTFPIPPYGYTYSFTVNGREWGGTVTGELTVKVTKIPITYTITYDGDYEDETYADYNTNVTFPTPPYGYTYSFTANGEEWDGTVTGDLTVTVTKIPVTYTITYVGDYTGEAKAEYLTSITLPTAPEGYIYRFTENEIVWSGDSITKDATIDVKMLCDMAELEITNIEDAVVIGNEISGKYYERYFVPEGTISKNAVFTVFADTELSEKTDGISLKKGKNTFFAKVTAESGREEIYTIIIDRDIPETLGELTVLQTIGGSLTMQVEAEIKGNPSLYLYYGYSIDDISDYVRAEYIPETDTIFAGGLSEDTGFYIKVIAVYDELRAESTVVHERTSITLSSDCYIIRTLTPPGGEISHGNDESDLGVVTGLSVTNKFEDITIDVEVSKGATWGLYRTASSSSEISKTVSLNAGRTVTRYIRVTSQDGEHRKTYSISIYRQSKSTQPVITVMGGLVTITAEENSTVIYTTDKSEPSENNGVIYTAPFTVDGGTVVKAIAKQDGIDEYSDIVIYTLPASFDINIVPLDDEIFTDSKGYLNYAFNLEAPEAFSGKFILALYDDMGQFICLDTEIITEQTEYYAEGSIKAERLPAEYRAFLWSGENTIAPLTEMVRGHIE